MRDQRSDWQVEADLKALAKAECLTWRRTDRGTTYRLWFSETEYRRVTAKERRVLESMIERRVVNQEMAAGRSFCRFGPITCW